MNELDTYTFTKETGDGCQTIEHSYVSHQDGTWMPIMLQFASFLEGCGYVGVYQRVRNMIDYDIGKDDWK